MEKIGKKFHENAPGRIKGEGRIEKLPASRSKLIHNILKTDITGAQ